MKRTGLLLVLFIFLFYHFFLSSKLIIAHDWPLLFPQSRDFSPFWSLSWDYMGQGGLGGPAFKTLWIDLYTNLVYFFSNSLNIPWWISQRIFWIIPFLALSIFSSYKFATLFIQTSSLRSIGSIIYSFNTYILLIVAGGQFGIAFSYALFPLAFYEFINLSKKPSVKKSILFGLVYGLTIIADPRIALILFILQFFWFMSFIRTGKTLKLYLLSLLIASLINTYWILPLMLFRGSSDVFSSYSSLQAVKFLSFANFSNVLSLLHPNWPENIFGKVYFLDPKFLLIPIFAFSPLILKMRKEIIFFAVVSLFGIFLGKGVNDPFGQIYLFLSQNIPGFGMFRDSTKFFILVAISYSILISYFLENLPRFKKLLIALFILFWLISLKPGWDGQLTGIFKPKEIPPEYLALNEFTNKDKTFNRTLWVPERQKYGLFDPLHPAIDYGVLKTKLDEKLFQDLSIKYVIVPQDSEGEIFLKDRKYDEKLYFKTLKKIEDVKWLNKVKSIGKIAVFALNGPKDHFWSPDKNLMINYKFISPTEYKVQVQNAKKGNFLIFSEGFDVNWIAESSKFKLKSSKFDNRLNAFSLPENGNYELNLSYEPQRYVGAGLWVSLFTFLASIGFIAFGKRLKK